MNVLATNKQVDLVRSDLKRLDEANASAIRKVRLGESPKWVNHAIVLGLFVSLAGFILMILKHWLGW